MEEKERGGGGGGGGGRRRRRRRRRRFLQRPCLQLGHPGGVEAHGAAGGAGGVTHLPQHPAPLLLIVLVPEDRHESGPAQQHGGDIRPRSQTYCQTSVTSVGATSLFSIWIMAKPPTANRAPPVLTRFTELRSWGNSVKGSHLRRGGIQRRSSGRRMEPSPRLLNSGVFTGIQPFTFSG